MDSFEQAKALFFAALDHHQNNRFPQAETMYRAALEHAPERSSILVNLSAVLIAMERFDEAREFASRALVIEPTNNAALEHLEQCQAAEKSIESQIDSLRIKTMQNPGNIGLQNNLGVKLLEAERFAEAKSAFDEALRLQPSSSGLLLNRARAYEALGYLSAAASDYRHVLRLKPEDGVAGRSLTSLLRRGVEVPGLNDSELEKLLIQGMRQPWMSPQALVSLVIPLLRRQPEVQAVLSYHHSAPVFAAAQSLSSSNLLLTLLECALVTDVELERILIEMRKAFLAMAHPEFKVQANLDVRVSDFLVALAMQCFLNEYVYLITEEEQFLLDKLLDQVSVATRSGLMLTADCIAILASYVPLDSIDGIDSIAAKHRASRITKLLVQQVEEPASERRLRSYIPQLTAVDDNTSRIVQHQYEQHPYPRWRTLPQDVIKLPAKDIILRQLGRTEWPGRAPDFLGNAQINALNAGCGTGQHSAEMALTMANLDLLAVDLSMASLSHAKRMSNALGLENISFAQADILELGGLKDRFDIIESVGVLHHLEEPAKGLASLVRLLSEQGVMRIGVYSELARRNILKARSQGAFAVYEDINKTMRDFRQLIMSLPETDPRYQLTRFIDFYSLSECRDLIFHAREHRFTIPELEAFLAVEGLEFLGFVVDVDTRENFRKAYPFEGSERDLSAWHEFEVANPDTFAAMYIFWVQKSDLSAELKYRHKKLRPLSGP